MSETQSFTLLLDGVQCVDEDVAERIYSRIDNALLYSSNGFAYLDFDREAPSMQQAIASACMDVYRAGYGVLTARFTQTGTVRG